MKIIDLLNPVIIAETSVLQMACEEFVKKLDPMSRIREVTSEEVASEYEVEAGDVVLELPVLRKLFYGTNEEELWRTAAIKLIVKQF